jgi:hypothetical protein
MARISATGKTVASGLYLASGIYFASGIGVVTAGGAGGGGQVSGAVQVSGIVGVSGTVNAVQQGAWGVQVSGAVIVSGTVTQASGAYLASGHYVVVPGVQVSGAVIVSGAVTTSVSGQPVNVVSGFLNSAGINVATFSGQYVVLPVASLSGMYLASGLYVYQPPASLSGQYFASGIGVTVPITSGSVIVSGSVFVSGTVFSQQTGTWGVQVSGAVIVSGTVTTSVSGNVVDLKVPTAVTSNAGIFVVTGASGGAILTSGPCISVIVKAMSQNSGDIYVRGFPMQSGEGYVLEAGEAINLDVDNFGRVYLLAAISGDRVTYVGVQ